MSLLRSIEPSLLTPALEIARRLRNAGFLAFFAGGAVRDLLLGRRVSDVDIATSAPPETVEALFPHTIPVGRRFGVVVVVFDDLQYEVATFRRDIDYRDGRHPSSVEFGDARRDALRRDFTVNALFLDPESEEVVDYVEGRKDLKRRLIRTVGAPAERFREDRLRLLRAVRFACRLGFQIEEETWGEVCRQSSWVTEVSWERIRDELLGILTGNDASRGLDLLLQSSLLRAVLPEVAAMAGIPQPPEYHPEGDVFTHTRKLFEYARSPDEILALAMLLHDVGKPPTFSIRERIRFDGHAEVGADMVRKIGRRLRLSKEQIEQVEDLVRSHLRFIHVREMRESTLKRFLRMENFTDHLELHRLDCLASHGDLTNYRFCLEKLQELDKEKMRPPPLISGRDLIREGYAPGPLFKTILNAVEDLQLEGRLSTREEALEWVRRNHPPPRV